MKLTLEQLIQKRLDLGQQQSKNVEIKALGGELTIVKIPLDKLVDSIEEMQSSDTLQEKFNCFKNMIYQCCPIMHNEKLQAAYECVEPTDIVSKLLDDNMGDLEKLANTILDMYGLDADTKEDKSLKNQVKN